ncbi:conserved hypothetical protein [Leishmania braziliensis MHOM/BR/75/M2904]|uniref:CHASE domain-containing protein n=2 Tax=Leishmania braziliensis TaxID=5660 RepID=A4H5K7_LEIBR|nr:conserved hypothetical protein [Leishmania braziliensis MHOM/BR/75/M2904]CAJ2467378.1 unnamed protein product [Leishmania braziliensis]CAM41771.1 conserved hypothetical protein [Leishmania braziliensis MHOM/BR/75/M2904]SYZ63252.1 hypothetical_protein [Leishmania braziliensis MHOM/BR/75/M2904]
MKVTDATQPRVIRTRLPPLRAQTRLYIGIVAFSVCLLLIFVGVFSSLIVLRNIDKNYEREVRLVEYTLANAAVAPFRVVMVEALGISQALEGYVMSQMTVLPNLSAPPAERIHGQNFVNFDSVGRTLVRNMTMISMTALQPGGVYAFISPANAASYGRDTLDINDNSHNFKPTPLDTILDGHANYVGPFRSTSEILRGYWGFAVRRPIFNRTDYSMADIHTFWGFTFTLVNISGILSTNPFDFSSSGVQQSSFDYLLSVVNETSGVITVLETSLQNPTAEQLEEFRKIGTTIDIAPNLPFAVTVRGRDYGAHLSPTNITIVVSTALSGLLAIFATVIAAVLWCTRVYDGTKHAPKMAPFAMLTIGPCRGEELWDLAAEQMAEVTDRLDGVLVRQMVRHGAYQIQQVHPLTTSYVTRSVAAAVQMAFSAIEELQRRPIDGPLRAVLGDEGRLLLSYAVHWCTDAAVRVESLDGTYRYEGPDVVFGGRMWAFAAPSVLTASEAVAQALPRFGLRSVDARPLRMVNVIYSWTRYGTADSKEPNDKSAASATIYVPYPLPITLQNTAGGRRGSAISSKVALIGSNSDTDDAQLVTQQQLFTLLDARRPALVAAASVALCNVDGFPSASHANKTVTVPVIDVRRSNSIASSVPTFSAVDGSTTNSARFSTPTRTGASSSGPSENNGNELLSVRSLSMGTPLQYIGGSFDNASNGTTKTVPVNSFAFQGDAVTRALLQPFITRSLDVALRAAFDYQSITLDIRYDSVRVLVYYFYSSYKILFRPLAAPERHNIFRRLVTAFGVPQQGILEHLAARCVIRYVQHRLKAYHSTLPHSKWPSSVCEAPSVLKAQ